MARRISSSQLRSQFRQLESKLRSIQSRAGAEARRAQARRRAALSHLRLIEARLHNDLGRLHSELRSLAASGVGTVVIARCEWDQVPYDKQIEIRSLAVDEGIDLEVED